MMDTEPLLRPIAIDALHPTQITVGFREVARKREAWVKRLSADRPGYLGAHMIPAVIGPKGRHWIIDNHHLALALHGEGVTEVLVRIVADLSGLSGGLFKTFMDNRNWFHPFDAKGRRRAISQIPKHVYQLIDDPYRSLAGELRRAGGYAKDNTPFAEFLWADYLRRHIDADLVERHFERAVKMALKLARNEPASYLPGWAGPHK